jgi:hypothetical protein
MLFYRVGRYRLSVWPAAFVYMMLALLLAIPRAKLCDWIDGMLEGIHVSRGVSRHR